MATTPVTPFTCDLVIARYKENLDWLKDYEEYDFQKICVYNKGPNDGICRLKDKQCIQVQLKNEGRCDHTYLYHIIHEYDNLADVTVFTKGSSYGAREKPKLKFTVKKVFETRNSVFSVTEHYIPVDKAEFSYTLDYYASTHKENHDGVGDSDGIAMKPAETRPFGKWYEKYFPGITTTKAVYSGVFAVSKPHILQHPKSYYEDLIKQLEGHSNPEVGHFFERAWLAIFHPIPDGCTFHDILHENPTIGGSRRRRYRRTRRKRLKKRRHTR